MPSFLGSPTKIDYRKKKGYPSSNLSNLEYLATTKLLAAAQEDGGAQQVGGEEVHGQRLHPALGGRVRLVVVTSKQPFGQLFPVFGRVLLELFS